MGGFALGWQAGQARNAEKRQRKDMLEDEERRTKVADLHDQRIAFRDSLSTLNPADPGYQQAYDQAKSGITNIETQLSQLYHPVNAPGALQKDWGFLTHLITRKPLNVPAPVSAPPTTTAIPDSPIAPPASEAENTFSGVTVPPVPPAPAPLTRTMNIYSGPVTPGAPPPPTRAVPLRGEEPPQPVSMSAPAPALPGKTTTVRGENPAIHDTMAVPTANLQGLVAPGNLPIWNRPSVANDDGTHSSEFSTSFTDENKNSPYYGKEVLVPTVVDGKFLTPDGKKPPEGSQAEHDMLVKARDHYEKTGQHLGIFQSPTNADHYAEMLHKRGEKKKPNPNSYLTPQQRKLDAQAKQAEKDADQFLKAAPPSDAQKTLSGARSQVAAQRAKVDAYMEDYDKAHPDATKEERERYRQRVFENVAGFKSATLGAKWVYKTGKVHGQPVTVRYNEKDPEAGMEHIDGTPLTDDEAGAFQLDAGKIPPGMTYDKATGQVVDKATGKRYDSDSPDNPPEVQAMFRGHDLAQTAQQAYGLRLTQERGQSYNNSRPIAVLDTLNGNRPTEVRFDDFRASPGRYTPAAAGAKALAQVNMFEDIGRTSRATRFAINDLKEDFPEDMKAKIAVALTADDHGGALNALLSSAAFANLSKDQYGFLVATRQLSENAMAMRSILGAGQGSEDVRRAIQSTLPNLLSPNRAYALMQLDAFDKTLEQLHRGIQNVPLGQEGWTVAGGDYKPPADGAPSPGAAPPGGTQPPKLKGGRSITQVKAWMQQQPQWQGQTVTNDMATKYITDNHYTPTQ